MPACCTFAFSHLNDWAGTVSAESPASPARCGEQGWDVSVQGAVPSLLRNASVGWGSAFTPTLEQELGQSGGDEHPGVLLRGADQTVWYKNKPGS